MILKYSEFIKLTENDEDGMKSVNTSMGSKMQRYVVSSDKEGIVEKNQEKILKMFVKYDPEAKGDYYPKTGKVVMVAAEYKESSYKKELLTIDKSLKLEKKPIAASLKKENKNADPSNMQEVVLDAIENIDKWLDFKIKDLIEMDKNSAIGVIAGYLEDGLKQAVKSETAQKYVYDNLIAISSNIYLEIQKYYENKNKNL